jgi:hypothetical protein
MAIGSESALLRLIVIYMCMGSNNCSPPPT